MGDRTRQQRPAPEDYNDLYRLFLTGNEYLLQNESLEETDDQVARRIFDMAGVTFNDSWKNKLGSVPVFRQLSGYAISNRRFRLTNKGYMGLVPPATKEGDILCIILEADMPFLLRSVERDKREADCGVKSNKEETENLPAYSLLVSAIFMG